MNLLFRGKQKTILHFTLRCCNNNIQGVLINLLVVIDDWVLQLPRLQIK